MNIQKYIDLPENVELRNIFTMFFFVGGRPSTEPLSISLCRDVELSAIMTKGNGIETESVQLVIINSKQSHMSTTIFHPLIP